MNYFLEISRAIMMQRRSMAKDAAGAATANGANKRAVDLLQLLMDAETKREDGTSDVLSEEEITSNIFLILLAGFETTGSLLTFSTYELACNPLIQERLRREVTDAVSVDDGEVKFDTIMSLKFLDAVVNESLRCYAAVVDSNRLATRDYKIESHGIRVQKGVLINIPVYAMHHDPLYHPNPFTFDPERFMPENRDKIKPYTFLPFLHGPRNCIGSRFALLEVKTALAVVLMKYDILKSDRTAVPLDLSPSTLILGAKEVVVRYRKR